MKCTETQAQRSLCAHPRRVRRRVVYVAHEGRWHLEVEPLTRPGPEWNSREESLTIQFESDTEHRVTLGRKEVPLEHQNSITGGYE